MKTTSAAVKNLRSIRTGAGRAKIAGCAKIGSAKIGPALACAALILSLCVGPAFAGAGAEPQNGGQYAREHHDRGHHRHWRNDRGYDGYYGYGASPQPYGYGAPSYYYASPGFGMSLGPGIGIYVPLGRR